jgi:UDP-N-acetylglucosamine enolpyruvyl transferase
VGFAEAVAAGNQRDGLFVVHLLSGTIEPSGNKNAALPIIAATLLTDQPVHLSNVPRIRDTETLVDLIRSIGARATWTGKNLEVASKVLASARNDQIEGNAAEIVRERERSQAKKN